MSKRCPGEPPMGTIPPAQPHIPPLDGMKRKTKEGRSMRACIILAKELAIRRPRIKLSAGPPARTRHDQLRIPPNPGVTFHHGSATPLPPFAAAEIADIPLPPPHHHKTPSPAPASSDAPSLPPSTQPLRQTG
ncbi:hypothetical protein JTB14_035459 [Gonioctena quinquepunctata]|nr:hypothetical protein JTB14_035459 [Gonioctena quinquepunctata]